MPPAPASLAGRASYVAFGAIAYLTREMARQYELRLQHGMLDDLCKLLAASPAASHLSDAAYCRHLLGDQIGLDTTHSLRRAAAIIPTAPTLDDLEPETVALSDAVKTDGLPRFARAMQAAANAGPVPPPKPGPTSARSATVFDHLDPISSAQAQGLPPEEENRGLIEDFVDPLAPVRIARFNSALSTLRSLDPQNPQLTYVTGPGYVPSEQAIETVEGAVRDAAFRRVRDFIMPNGQPIGRQGGGRDIRVVPGGLTAAQQAFEYLRVGGTPFSSSYPGTMVTLPGGIGTVGLRPVTSSPGSPAVDVNIIGIPYSRIHY